ncbi:sulfite exporter TauE/SafE family protein [Pseudidiomarina insulisalsae]|uniref:Sulfite exporter TauE/SafE family protein n=1 Tax=Pseudidiomarina insulisalsae TaxID=575789 RepID=A0A432YH86_9GAMM|nr:sulfite exporter TauE/SafE family protein [Pseudidiomarina insulisalsae]RUO60322.1 sulfite exporter TauE/SafE family protein [Pseudidiomarina insulisalsae]
MNLDLFAALLMGLAGAGHCLMMCGGLAGALPGGQGQRPALLMLISYNLGRISSYMLAGALVGAISQAALGGVTPALLALRFLAAFFLIALGCYLGGWWLGLQRLEQLGRPLWRHLAPLAARLRQHHSISARYIAGMVWGWLPCGLVYSALSWAALSASATSGAIYMLFFGLGTLPAMLAFGWFSGALQSILKGRGFRQAMGVLMIIYGLWVAVIALRQVLAIN